MTSFSSELKFALKTLVLAVHRGNKDYYFFVQSTAQYLFEKLSTYGDLKISTFLAKI
jgi:hypothetical protein